MQIPSDEKRHARRSVAGSIAAALALGVPALTTASLWLGLGLGSGAGHTVALAAALGLTALPIAGLAAILGWLGGGRHPRGRAAILLATWLWSLAFWLWTPDFAPGERRAATKTGALVLLAPLPDGLAGPLADGAAMLAGWLGDEGVRTSPVVARFEGLGVAPGYAAPPDDGVAHERAAPADDGVERGTARRTGDRTTRETARRGARGEHGAEAADAPAKVVLPYEGDGRMLDVEVTLDGPEYGDRFRMIFDTGASFTTVTPDALARIDVRIPGDAPRVTLNTAGGEIEAPLVLLDAVWLGDRPVEWVTVAVCTSCTAGERAGLLGLNVSGQFRVEIDHARKRIHLDPRPGDRRQDIRAWIGLNARAVRHGDEKLDIEVTMNNRAPHAIAEATVEIGCGASGFAVQLTDVPARGAATTGLSVPGASGLPSCDAFSLDLLDARWAPGRF